MADANQKRAWVGEMYPGPRWKKRVAKMSDAQITAIYLRAQQEKPKEPPPKESNDGDEFPF